MELPINKFIGLEVNKNTSSIKKKKFLTKGKNHRYKLGELP